ncbi:hypothetical protein BY996DRAFT_6516341 [Phakopsora pachyrhizi]|nr:hypothetical protein BY996DRAFT_6516341 [Phakopsora pachyrhizi]
MKSVGTCLGLDKGGGKLYRWLGDQDRAARVRPIQLGSKGSWLAGAVCLDITMPDNEYDRRPTTRNKKFGLNEDQSQ